MKGEYHIHILFHYTESNPALSELIKENDSKLKFAFGELLDHVCTELEKKNVSPDNFRTVAKVIWPACIPNSSNIRTMFDAITDNAGWSYLHYRSLKGIQKHWKITDNETKKKLFEYTQLLNAHNVTVKIVNWIKQKDLDKKDIEFPQPLPSHDCTELSAKLRPYKVTDKTLQYVKELWEAIAEDLLELPDLDAVLYDIKEGCLFITWLISASEEMKQLIRRRVSCCEEFFKTHSIIQFILNDECIYEEQVCMLLEL